MSEENVEQLRGAYDDFNQGKPDTVIAMMDENVEWTEPGGGNSFAGTFTGPQSVGEEVFALIPQNFEEFSVTPENFDDQGDTVVVSGRFKGKNKSGNELDSAFTHTWVFEDGKVAKFTNSVDEGWAAGWS